MQHTLARQHQQPAPTPLAWACGPLGLYLHVPFCFHKCHYCDFFSVTTLGEDLYASFTTRLIDELCQAAARLTLKPLTVFIGGGTPTLLPEFYWARLLEALHAQGVMERVVEFTVEANPETVTPALLNRLAQGGVNRLSIGAQSFNPDALKMLERHHDPANVGRAVEMARAAGIANVSLDVIFAVPGQDVSQVIADLDAALALKPNHLSSYGLTYEPSTPMTARLRAGRIQRVDEDQEARMYDAVITHLTKAGFEPYEVSNWAGLRPRHEPSPAWPSSATDHPLATYFGSRRAYALHNLAYWLNADWQGLGPSAASHSKGERWRNVPNLTRYLQGKTRDDPDATWQPPTEDHERLKPSAQLGEQLMLRLRLRRGVPVDWLSQHLATDDFRRTEIDQLIAWNLLHRQDDHLRLTPRGLMVADSVLARLL